VLAAIAGALAALVSAAVAAGPVGAAAGCAAGSDYDDRVLLDAPIAYWPLGAADAVEDCAGGHTGAYVAGPATTTTPNGDPARAFNGIDQYAQIPAADDLSVPRTGILTLEAWLRPDVLQFPRQEGTGYVHWAGKGGPRQHEYVARIYSLTNAEDRPNRISGYAFNPAGGLGVGSFSQDPVVAGGWIHYVLVINTVDTSGQFPSGYTKIYRDGVRRDQDSLAALGIVPAAGSAPLRIGTRDLHSFFAGAIAKVAVYDREPAAAELRAHYRAMTGQQS